MQAHIHGFRALFVWLLVSAPSLAADGPKSSVRFELYQHLVVVKGSIGRLEGLNFLIDTGATRTIVDQRIAMKLGLEPLPGLVRLRALGQADKAYKAIVPSVHFGPTDAEPFSLLVMDLSAVRRTAPIDAIVGLDLLCLKSFQIDFETGRISFGRTAHTSPSVPFQTLEPLLTVDLTIGGRPLRMLVDTGAHGLTLFRNRARSRPLRFSSRGQSQILAALGGSPARDIELLGVRLGQTRWPPQAAFLDVPGEAYAGIDGLLGGFPRAVRLLGFDFERKRLYWSE